eukprot:evm.model.NODE_33039_length_19041_cov_18.180138.1
MSLLKANDELQHNLSAVAHLVHGSSEGRFTIIYATNPAEGGLTQEEVEGVGYGWRDYKETIKLYDPHTMTQGVNIMQKEERGGEGVEEEEVYFVQAPALGLWAAKTRFQRELGGGGGGGEGGGGGKEGGKEEGEEMLPATASTSSPVREPPSKRTKGEEGEEEEGGGGGGGAAALKETEA